MNGVYDKMSGPTRMVRRNEYKGKVTNELGAMVAAVPVVRATSLGALRDPKQARILGQKGRAIYKSQLEGLSNKLVYGL